MNKKESLDSLDYCNWIAFKYPGGGLLFVKINPVNRDNHTFQKIEERVLHLVANNKSTLSDFEKIFQA